MLIKPKKVLILEDEPVIQRVCKRLIEDRGHVSVIVSSVQKVLEIMREGEFDLLMADINLPDGEGRGVALKFMTQFPHSKVVLMTGAEISRAKFSKESEAEFHFLLKKPFTLEEFHLILDRCGVTELHHARSTLE